MFGSDDDDRPDLGDIVDQTKARLTRDPDRPCDVCGTEEGSVVVERETDTARCNDCLNDPSTWEDS